MGGSINDEDFTLIILGSIPLSYDTFISAMSANPLSSAALYLLATS